MKKVLLVVIMLFILPLMPANAAISDYLILNNIGTYEVSQPQIYFPGEPATGGPSMIDGPGVLSSSYHYPDHADKTYQVRYIGINEKPSPKVQVTQHVGVDSDKWLLHEIEDSYRDGDNSDNRLGLFSGAGVKIRDINSNKIIYCGLGGGSYTWICNQIVVEIKYTDLRRIKPEPIEIVKAYLAKSPSTITATDTEFKSKDYNIKWIKDEMERRLWLCDKWLMQLQLGKANQADTLKALVKHMTVFLNYRQKYYSVTAAEELAALNTALRASDGTTIKNKLTAYKSWWSANKAKRILLWRCRETRR